MQIARERLGFVRKNFHLGHVRSEERKVIINEDSQLFERIVNSPGALLQTFEHPAKTMILDQKQ